MKIYEFNGGANPKRLRAFLSEKGLLDSIEFELVDVANGVNRQAEFKKKNSKGTLPVLELDDGTCISEGVAICRYFEEIHPDPPLFGRDAKGRAIVEMWNRRLELGLFRFTDDVVRNTAGFFKNILIQSGETAEVGRKTAAQECEWLDKELANRRYVAGDDFTIADITLLACFYLGEPSIWQVAGNYPNMERWFDLVSKRDAARCFAAA